MSILTAVIIASTPIEELVVCTFQPMRDRADSTLWGFYIGCYEETPSGHRRPRPLLSSVPVYVNSADAMKAAQQAIDYAKQWIAAKVGV